MTKPIKAATHFLSNPIDDTTSFVNNAFGKSSAGSIDFSALAPKDPPPTAPAASTPTAKPAKKGQQSSFLSGVAASSLGGRSSSSSGKTLLGA